MPLLDFTQPSNHVAEPASPPAVSNEKAALASSNSSQKSAAGYTCAEHVLTGQT